VDSSIKLKDHKVVAKVVLNLKLEPARVVEIQPLLLRVAEVAGAN
jgi:hypothetical protein